MRGRAPGHSQSKRLQLLADDVHLVVQSGNVLRRLLLLIVLQRYLLRHVLPELDGQVATPGEVGAAGYWLVIQNGF